MRNHEDQLSVFPVFFKVENRFAVVVGDGVEAAAKARLLRESRIAVRVVSRAPSLELATLAIEADIEIIAAHFSPQLIDGATLVFAATANEELDRQVVEAARAMNIPVNAVDRPHLCDFYTPALVNRAPVAIAIGTEGTGPVLSQMIRARIEAIVPVSTGKLARLAQLYRLAADRLVARGAPRRRFWRAFFDGDVSRHVENGDLPAARRSATRLLKNPERHSSHVTVVFAVTGEADLMTLRAVRAMQEADAIVFDETLPADLVKLGRRDAERHGAEQARIVEAATSVFSNRDGEPVRLVILVRSPAFTDQVGALCAALGATFEIIPGVETIGLSLNQSIAA